MKVVCINGSPHENGNTAVLINKLCEELSKSDIETKVISLGGTELKYCLGCMKCIQNKNNKCIISNDRFNEIFEEVIEAEGVVLCSPVYNASVTAQIKAFIDRAGLVSLANGGLLRRKVGGAIVAARRGGAVSAFDTLNHLFLEQQMVLVGSSYWNIAYGMDVKTDQEGLKTIEVFGENMAWLLKKLY